MAASGQDNFEDLPEAVVEGQRKSFAVVWLLPIVALLAGGWLVYKTFSEKGPEITISFNTAEGLEEGKTLVKSKDVKVGTVDKVVFAEDLSHVLVTVNLVPGVEPYLTDKTRFWVVRPRVGAGEVSGLGTLVSGSYIAVDPDRSGEETRRFEGLEKPPVITTNRKGTSYRLKAGQVGSLSVGAPVYFRQMGVGEVTAYGLSEDHESVEIDIFIESPHDRFVHEGTSFWNASGIDVSMDASGIRLEMQSLVSLLGGGIAFETPPFKSGTPLAKQGYEFPLYANHTESLERPITDVTTFALTFSDTVRGLDVGAPVELRGIRIGTVKAIELGTEPHDPDTLVPVVIADLEPQRLEAYSAVTSADNLLKERKEFEDDPVALVRSQIEERGLRARLQTGSLVTGKLFVELDFYPNAPPVTLRQTGKYPEIPTMPGSLQGILAGIQRLLDKLDAADLKGTLINLNKLMESTSNLMAAMQKDAPELASEFQATLVETRSMLRKASATLQTVGDAASTEGEIGNQLQGALKEISAAARSVRVMAEYLERHPDAMLKGKGTR